MTLCTSRVRFSPAPTSRSFQTRTAGIRRRVRRDNVRSLWLCGYMIFAFFLTLNAQTGAKNGEWPTYGADLGNTHYSPLDQITAGNFAKLQVVWRLKTDNFGPRPE